MEDDKKLTCITCRLLFANSAEQVSHYKTELHRFNLKRKVVDLLPVTQEQFDLKVDQIKKEAEEHSFTLKCNICSKDFASRNKYNEHLASKKHKNTEKELKLNPPKPRKEKEEGTSPKPETQEPEDKDEKMVGEKIEGEEEDDGLDEEMRRKIRDNVAVPIDTCLFCNAKSATFEENMEHMTTVHSLFIPDLEYIEDLEGLIVYLGEKVGIGNVCLFCNGAGRSFQSIEAVQGHMRDTSHCKLAWENNEDEYADFYDYRASYDDPNSIPTDLENHVPKSRVEVSDFGTELVFPDGRSIGHRSLKVYYKQHYAAPESRESVLLNRLANQYKLLGWYNEDRRSSEISKIDHRKISQERTALGMRHNWLHRWRTDNVAAKNSGR
eukprot:TRINITY_DN7634_c0_g7_i1.p1 TRINITY_DN7634_c0_g7~~TRINITY_DN7634_c0_g7_i1.p1  ORF type:complete len:381 (+),score=71.65 TRINITY_DN7634_c0_g7_i1:184-1326(+)